MKAAFIYTHRFHRDEQDRVWSTGQFPSTIWLRYLEHFPAMVVVARLTSGIYASKNGLVLSSHPRVRFELLDRKSRFKVLNSLILMAQVIQECDAIILRTSHFGIAGAILATLYRKPWAVEVVGCPWDAFRNEGSLVRKVAAPVVFLATRFLVARSRFVLYVTKRFLQERYPPSRAIVSLGCSDIELPSISRGVLQKRLKRIRQRSGGFIRFGLIGTLKTRYKGIQTVLRALASVRQQLPNVEFRILGTGSTAYWERLASHWGVSDVVWFDGLRPSGEPVFEWLDEIDIYLQPSLQEGLPRALIEAMSRACPALGSTCGGIPELLDEEEMVTPGDDKALAQLMVKASEDRFWQEAQAERNWMRSKDYLSVNLNERRSRFWSDFAEHARSIRRKM